MQITYFMDFESVRNLSIFIRHNSPLNRHHNFTKMSNMKWSFFTYHTYRVKCEFMFYVLYNNNPFSFPFVLSVGSCNTLKHSHSLTLTHTHILSHILSLTYTHILSHILMYFNTNSS